MTKDDKDILYQVIEIATAQAKIDYGILITLITQGNKHKVIVFNEEGEEYCSTKISVEDGMIVLTGLYDKPFKMSPVPAALVAVLYA